MRKLHKARLNFSFAAQGRANFKLECRPRGSTRSNVNPEFPSAFSIRSELIQILETPTLAWHSRAAFRPLSEAMEI